MIVDTHCHTSPYWFEPVEVLLAEMDRNGVDKAVLTQFFGVFDNSYMIECMRNHPGRFSVIALVDVNRPDAADQLVELANQGVESLRLNANMRSPGADPLAIWRKANELGVSVSVMGALEDFASTEFENIVKELPSLTIINEHLLGVGAFFGPGRADAAIPYDTYNRALELAQYSNTYVKVPGLGEFCPRPMPFQQPYPFADVPPLIEMALDAFGGNRLMWGSDFPPSAAREGYANTLNFPRQKLADRSQGDRDLIFGDTAATLWSFGE